MEVQTDGTIVSITDNFKNIDGKDYIRLVKLARQLLYALNPGDKFTSISIVYDSYILTITCSETLVTIKRSEKNVD